MIAPKECTVSNVHINPCPEADEGHPCRVKKGRTVSISYDLTPTFRIETLESQAYWPNGRVDLPLVGMETDGCKSTTCPIEENTTKSYQWHLDVDKKFPTRQYTVKMMMKSQEENFCCFLFTIKLTK